MRRHQTGTLYELYIIAVILVIAGVLLAGKHPAFLVLVAAGIVLFLLPWFLGVRDWLATLFRHAPAAKKRLQELCTEGFRPAVVVRARVREGGAYIAADIEAGKVAFITQEDCTLVDLSTIKEVQLTSGTVSQWGKPERKRYGFSFVPKDNSERFGLSYPRKAEASKSFRKLREVLNGHITFNSVNSE